MADGEIEWFYPESGKGQDASINDIIAHLAPVRKAVYAKAIVLATQATMALAGHRRTGVAQVAIGRHPRFGARSPDWYVYLRDADPGGGGLGDKNGNKRDRSAMSIEFGWVQTHAFGKKLADPIKHEGLHILGDVMKRAAGRYRGPK